MLFDCAVGDHVLLLVCLSVQNCRVAESEAVRTFAKRQEGWMRSRLALGSLALVAALLLCLHYAGEEVRFVAVQINSCI